MSLVSSESLQVISETWILLLDLVLLFQRIDDFLASWCVREMLFVKVVFLNFLSSTLSHLF